MIDMEKKWKDSKHGTYYPGTSAASNMASRNNGILKFKKKKTIAAF